MSAVAPRLECDHVREWASLQLDGELSEFERVLMDAHLAVCAECTRFRESIAGFTSTLRAVSLEPSERPVVVRRARRAISFRRVPAAAAALVVATVGVASLFASAEFRGATENSPWAQSDAAADVGGTNVMRQAGQHRRQILLARRQADRVVLVRPGQLGGGPVR
jgi:predicted anti-sigma-YlaC factor YlaD